MMGNCKSDSQSRTEYFIQNKTQEICASRVAELKKYLSVGRLGVTKKGKQVRKREQGSLCSNLPVARNRRFVINPVYSGAGTMIVKSLDFRLFESLKSALSRTFCSPKLFVKKWILHLPLQELSWIIPTSHNNANFNQKSLFNFKALFYGLKITNYWISNSFPALILLVWKQYVLLLTWIYCSWWRW